jgi:type I restriction enzyme, S subunit
MEVLQDTYTKIGLNLEILNGFPAKSIFFNNENKGLPLIRIRNILKGHSETYYSGEFDSKYLIKKGDILIGMDGDFNIAKWTGIPSILNQRICKLIDAKDPFNLEYLYYYLEVELKKIQARTPSTTVKHLSIKDLRKVNAYCPPLTEQQKIAAILSTVDEQLSTTDKIIEKSKELKKGLMQKLFSEGIGHTEFKDTKIGRVPQDWTLVPFSQLGEYYGGLSGKTKVNFGSGKPYIPFMNIMANDIIDVDYFDLVDVVENEKQNKAAKGDIFFNTSSETPEEVGMCAVLLDDISDLYLNSFCFGFRLNQEARKKYLPEYISRFMRSGFGRRLMFPLAQGMTRYNLSKKYFVKLEVPFPPLTEQQKIAAILSEADVKIEKEQTQKAQLEQLKKGLMQQLLTGKKRVA